jgi:hypothetical protein
MEIAGEERRNTGQESHKKSEPNLVEPADNQSTKLEERNLLLCNKSTS